MQFQIILTAYFLAKIAIKFLMKWIPSRATSEVALQYQVTILQDTPSHAHLSCFLKKSRFKVSIDIPAIDMPESMERIYKESDDWLNE